MRYNKLGGFGVPHREEDRGTGKSLGRALEYIGLALQKPSVWIKITDHYPKHAADKILFDTVRDLIHKLELKEFEFRVSDLSIRFDLYCDVPAPERVLSNGRILEKLNSKYVEFYEGCFYK